MKLILLSALTLFLFVSQWAEAKCYSVRGPKKAIVGLRSDYELQLSWVQRDDQANLLILKSGGHTYLMGMFCDLSSKGTCNIEGDHGKRGEIGFEVRKKGPKEEIKLIFKGPLALRYGPGGEKVLSILSTPRKARGRLKQPRIFRLTESVSPCDIPPLN